VWPVEQAVVHICVVAAGEMCGYTVSGNLPDGVLGDCQADRQAYLMHSVLVSKPAVHQMRKH
jgi:hypothetical protein